MMISWLTFWAPFLFGACCAAVLCLILAIVFLR